MLKSAVNGALEFVANPSFAAAAPIDSGTASTEPRVSIIIPAYKAATTLEKAARSAMDQTERSLEIIIVDDASPDATWDVAMRLRQADDRVRVERLTENSGKSHVMNFATNLARGRWIALLDADDWYAPDRIEQLVAAGEAAGVEMAADNLYVIDNHAGLCSGTGFPIQGSQRLIDLDVFLEMSNPTAKYDYGMLQPIFRADFIRKHAIEYYEPARISEDFYQLLCFFEAGGRAVVLDTPLYYYVEPFGSISRRWAQATRSPYNFESMLETHTHFAAMLGPRLSRRQRYLLDRRRAGIEAMISLHQINACVSKNDFAGVLERVLRAPPRLWKVVGRRLMLRLRSVLVPPRGSPIA